MSTKLIYRSDVKKAFKLKGIIGDIFAGALLSLLGLNRVNKIYSKVSHIYGREFTTAILKELKVRYEFNENALDNIPSEGPFIVVSNHPFGALDGVILLNVLSSVRPDVKFLANFIMGHVPNIKEFLLEVNPFENNKKWGSSYRGIRGASDILSNGGGLAIFPAGEVSTSYKTGPIRDRKWHSSVVKLMKNAKVPIIPVYFHGTNSNYFHWIGKIHPMLRTARLPGEALNKVGKTILFRIGKPVTVNEISEFKEADELGRHVRSRCYALEANIKGKEVKQMPENPVPIALPKNRKSLFKEIKSLEATNHLFTIGNFSCFLAETISIPYLIHELGRKREEAFRAVGEGTNKSLDLDTFDDYYKHLILWDNQKSKLVGAYRLGIGPEIMKKYGPTGFYTQTLFTYEEKFNTVLNQSIELGRSFVSIEYQKEALPLALLIKGLLQAVFMHDNIRYLFGPVSISSWYPKYYISLMYYFIKANNSIKDAETITRAKNPFFPDYLKSNVNELLVNKLDSVEKFDRYMLKLSDGEYRLPTLVKKYLKLNSKIISFNVDPDFNYSVDGLVLLDLHEVPNQEIITLAKDENEKKAIEQRFKKF